MTVEAEARPRWKLRGGAEVRQLVRDRGRAEAETGKNCLEGDAENARHEIAGHENAAPCCSSGKCQT